MTSGPHDERNAPASERDRKGIFGCETEYAVLYLPDDPADTWPPPFPTIEAILFDALLDGRKAAVSSGLKGGYFLENGGLVHLEIFLRRQGDTPVIEAATPECRSPRDLLAYQRAFDRILTDVSCKSVDRLRKEGFAGRIAFGKNNRDVRGIGYGCHENYLVHDKTPAWALALVLAAAPLLAVLLLPAILFILVILMAAVLWTTAERAFPRVTDGLRRSASARMPWFHEEARALYFVVMNALLFLPILVYSVVLRAAAFRRLQADLTSFLATRSILAGAGTIDFRTGCWQIAQRPALTTSLGEIVMFGRHKTVFDLKALLYDPIALFRTQRKFTITSGDSNLSDVPLLLATGTTALLIEMIEAGEDFRDLRLRRPLRAFLDVSEGGPWKELEMARRRRAPGAPSPAAGRRTAIDIQREYLARAQRYFAGKPEGRVRHGEILRLWEETLEQFSEGRGRLADRLDWAAKKSLLDAAILARGTWREFSAWGRIFASAPPAAVSESGSVEEFLARLGVARRHAIARRIAAARAAGDIDPRRFADFRDLFHQARKIDLRYHELSADPGYQRQLEAEGLIRRIATDEEIERATRHAPRDTRACVRGYFISMAATVESVRAGWNAVELTKRSRVIRIPDPFDPRMPAA